MFSSIFTTFFYNPLYNGLVFLISIVPLADVGIAIIVLTIFVKLILFPISKKAVRTQMKMKKLEPELNSIKKKYEKNKQAQSKRMMELYKENNINPFSGFLLILIQFPVIIALYWVFYKGGLPVINVDLLYNFVSLPEAVNMNFIGLVDMSGKSALLALMVGVTQYYQIKFSLPELKERTSDPSLKEDLARSLNLQMRYMMPIMIMVFSYIFSAAIALYFLTSNIFAIGQEIYIRKNVKEKEESALKEDKITT